MPSSRLLHVDVLRGVAALAVVWFHLTGSTGLSGGTASLGTYGYLGVEVFFVISGFIIPYSMALKGYRTGDLWSFLAKRILRLDPPYLAALGFGVALSAIAQGAAYQWPGAWRVIAHLGYANAFFGLNWLSPVFWTLAIEFQFYLVMSVAFRLVAHKDARTALVFLAVCALWPLVSPSKAFLPHWSGLFVLGALAFRRRAFSDPTGFSRVVGALALVVTFWVNGLPEATAGLVASTLLSRLTISDEARWSRPLLWLGTISYSLYLIHWDIGRTAVAVARHLPVLGSLELVRVFIGGAASLVAAWIFFLLIERPSVAWASRIGRVRDADQTCVPLMPPKTIITEADTW